MIYQRTLQVQTRGRGTTEITPPIAALAGKSGIRNGLCHVFIQHTSASLTINENADPDVRRDMEAHFNHFVPENQGYYQHALEGSDDMPAHIKASTLGSSLSIPISNGSLAMGTWQGIYLGEHRDHGGTRRMIVTLHGE